LEAFDTVKQFPNPFNPLTDTLPAAIDKLFDEAIAAVQINNETALLEACHQIEAYFNFPKPDERVKNAEIPGGMYTNMVAQLKQFNSLDILEDAMKLIPSVRLDAGLPPLVTPTSQIVGVQAVSSALNLKNGRDKYANASNQFVALVKGEYGKTPVPVDPEFRLKIAGTRDETPYDTSTYKRQENPVLPEFENVRLAKDEKEELLLELFPAVATQYLRKIRETEFASHQSQKTTVTGAGTVPTDAEVKEPEGYITESPMPGSVMKFLVKEGDEVQRGKNLFVLEAMKMENDVISEYSGKVYKIYVKPGDIVQAGEPIMKIVQ
jgi:pyruvate/oxaloacetate carboxyltransferase